MVRSTSILILSALSLEVCGQICRNELDGCKSFAFSSENEECRSFRTNKEDDLRGLLTFDTYILLEPC
jgi:hypothetical protein